MSPLGHGRLATLHDLHTEIPKHTVAYIIACLEINKYRTHKGTVSVHIAMHLLVSSMHDIVIIQNQQELIHSRDYDSSPELTGAMY